MGSNLGPGPPPSAVWGAADHTVKLYTNNVIKIKKIFRCHHAGASCGNMPATCDWNNLNSPNPNPQVQNKPRNNVLICTPTTELKMTEWKTCKGNTNMAMLVCHKYNSVLYSYIHRVADWRALHPFPPPASDSPTDRPNTVQGEGIGVVGGCERGWVPKREWRRARQSPIC